MTRTACILGATVAAALALCSVALADPRAIELWPKPYAAVSNETEAQAQVFVNGCELHKLGSIELDKSRNDWASFVGSLGTECGAGESMTGEIEEIQWNTLLTPWRIEVLVKGTLKYAQSSPKCEWELKGPWKTEFEKYGELKHATTWESSGSGTLVSGESGECGGTTKTFETRTKVWDEAKPAYVIALFRCEFLEPPTC